MLFVAGNIFVVIMLFLGFFVLNINSQNNSAKLYYYLLLSFGSWIFCIYFIGKLKIKLDRIPKLIAIIYMFKFFVIFLFELLNSIYFPSENYLFLGHFDFTLIKEYATRFLNGTLGEAWVPIGGEWVSIYYPPG